MGLPQLVAVNGGAVEPTPVRKRVAFEALGTPAPKGSGRAMLIGGRAQHIASGSTANQRALKGWDAALRDAARAAVGAVIAPPFVDQPLRVTLVFRMTRPSSHWGKGKNAGRLTPSAPVYPRTKPDADKLARSTLDSLTGIVFDDDARIVSLEVSKVYASPGHEGAFVTVEAMP